MVRLHAMLAECAAAASAGVAWGGGNSAVHEASSWVFGYLCGEGGGWFLTGKEKAALGCGLDSSRNRCACEKLNLRLYLLPKSPLQRLSLAITIF